MSATLSLEQALESIRKIRGFEDVSPDDLDAGPFLALTWRDYAELAAGVPVPRCGYVTEAFDCDKFVKWHLAHMNEAWALLCIKQGLDPIPLLHGFISGNVPCDGDSDKTDYHALAWVYCDDGKLRLYGCQQRSFMSDWRVEEIKEVGAFEMD